MAADQEVLVEIKADISQINKQLMKLGEQFKKTSEDADKKFSGLNKTFEKIGSGAKAATKSFSLLGKGFSNISGSVSLMKKGLSGAASGISNLGTKAADATAKIAKFTTVIAGIGTAGIGLATKKAADFEEELSNIQAVSGATTDEMKKLKDLSIKMGAATKYSASESAQGIEQLIKAGVSLDDIMNGGLEGALNLATAGELDLGEAADIASNALNAFKKDGLTVSKAADILAGAANASATDVRGLQLGLAQASAVASGVGLSFKDTATSLAVMAQNGLKGSDAGTSLKTMLLALQPQTKAQTTLFKKLGIITKDGANAFFDAQGHIKSMAEIAGILQDKLKGMSEQQRIATLQTMFGTDAVRAANILYKEGSKGIEKMAKSMTKVSAADVAKTKMDNLKGAIEQMKGSIETAEITLGEAFTPALKKVAEHIDKFVSHLNDSGAINRFAKFIQDSAIPAVANFAGNLKDKITPIISSFYDYIKTHTPEIKTIFEGVFGVLGTIIQNAASFVGKYVIPELANFVKYIQEHMPQIKDILGSVFDGFKSAAKTVSGYIQNNIFPIFGQLISFIQENLPQIKDVFKGVFDIMTGSMSNTSKTIQNVLIPMIQDLLKWFQENMPQIKDVAKLAFDVIYKAMKALGDVIVDDVLPLLGSLINFISDNKDTIEVVLTNAINVVKFAFDLLTGAIKFVMDHFDKLLPILAGITAALSVQFIINKLVGFYKAWATVTKTQTALQWLLNTALNANPLGLIAILIGVVVAAGVALYKNWDTIKAKLAVLWDSLKSVFGKIGSFIKGIWDGIKKGANTLWDGLKNGLKKFADGFIGIWDGIKKGIRVIVNPIIGFINGILSGIEKIINGLASAINKIPKFKVPDWVPGIGGKSFGLPKIGEIHLPRIPSLATGGVVENPTLAMIGDAGVGNPEIVSPERLMREIVSSELSKVINSMMNKARRMNNNSTSGSQKIEVHLHGDMAALVDKVSIKQQEDIYSALGGSFR
ncbi:phage tail tape measure protein [Tuberibacillus calidus]|jgi:TP901 family phage tail tape measure protein|uniref:phage tail tape measure protein n=1 Tax=Tuberibacillus calidus TaxID=340097 RepID=UPI000410519E|nr:phage tail tape measure protein [Tuberibacillus calidus]